MITLANKFSEWGYPVDFIVGADQGPYKKMLASSVNKIVLTTPKLGKARKIIRASRVLAHYLRSSGCQTMMSTIKELNVFAVLVKIVTKSNVRLIVREADTLDRIFMDRGLRNKLLYKSMQFTYPWSDGVIANCKITKNDLVSRKITDESSITVIYNPLSIKSGSNSLGLWREADKKIVACGRLHKKKNFSDLIRCVPSLKERYPNVSLKILGEGAEKEHLQKLICDLGLKDNVELVGFVDNPEDYYQSADVFVQTSLWEGFGYVLAEAMACGTPVVAYDSKGAMREILDNGKYGTLTPVGDLDALASAIFLQIEKPTPQEKLKEAVKRFDKDLIASQYLKALGINHV